MHDGAHQRVVNTGALGRSWNIVGRVGGHEHRVDDVNDTVAGVDVGGENGGIVDHDAVADGEGQGLSIDRFSRHALRKGGGGNVACHDVIEQDVGKGGFAFGRVEGSEVDTSRCKGLVGGCEQRERSGALECLEQFCLNNGTHQRGVDARALRRARDVVGRVRGHQHFVDDVDDTVAGVHVSDAHVGVVDHHAVSDGEGEWMAVDGRGGHAVGNVGSRDGAGHDVVEKDVREGFLALGSVEGGEVDAGVSEGLIRGCKHRERSGALECFKKLGLNHTGHEGIVKPGALGRARYVVGRVRWHQHFVDDVNQTV